MTRLSLDDIFADDVKPRKSLDEIFSSEKPRKSLDEIFSEPSLDFAGAQQIGDTTPLGPMPGFRLASPIQKGGAALGLLPAPGEQPPPPRFQPDPATTPQFLQSMPRPATDPRIPQQPGQFSQGFGAGGPSQGVEPSQYVSYRRGSSSIKQIERNLAVKRDMPNIVKSQYEGKPTSVAALDAAVGGFIQEVDHLTLGLFTKAMSGLGLRQFKDSAEAADVLRDYVEQNGTPEEQQFVRNPEMLGNIAEAYMIAVGFAGGGRAISKALGGKRGPTGLPRGEVSPQAVRKPPRGVGREALRTYDPGTAGTPLDVNKLTRQMTTNQFMGQARTTARQFPSALGKPRVPLKRPGLLPGYSAEGASLANIPPQRTGIPLPIQPIRSGSLRKGPAGPARQIQGSTLESQQAVQNAIQQGQQFGGLPEIPAHPTRPAIKGLLPGKTDIGGVADDISRAALERPKGGPQTVRQEYPGISEPYYLPTSQELVKRKLNRRARGFAAVPSKEELTKAAQVIRKVVAAGGKGAKTAINAAIKDGKLEHMIQAGLVSRDEAKTFYRIAGKVRVVDKVEPKQIPGLDKAMKTAGEQVLSNPINRTIPEKIKHWLTTLERTMFDDMAPFERALKKAGLKTDPTIEGALEPIQNPVTWARRFKQKSSAITHSWIMQNTTDINGIPNGKSMLEIITPVAKSGQLDEFMKWNYARVNLLRHEMVKPRGLQSKEELWKIYDAYNNPEWRAISDNITEWNKRGLKYMVDAGAMSEETYGKIVKAHKIYMPMLAEFHPDAIGRIGRGKKAGYIVEGEVLKRARGGEQPITDPIQGMIIKTTEQMDIAHRSMVSKTLADLIKTHGEEAMSPLIRRVKQQVRPVNIQSSQVKSAMKTLGMDVDDWNALNIPKDEPFLFFQGMKQYKGKDNIVPILEKGKVHFYEVDKDVFTVLKGLEVTRLHPVLNATFGKATRAIKLGATGLSPSFGLVRNALRDSTQALITAKHARMGPISSLKGTYGELTGSEAAKLFKGMGGEMTGQIGYDRILTQGLANDLAAVATGGGKRVWNIVTHPIQVTRKILGVPELGPRVAEFEKAFKWGEKKWGKGSPDAYIYAFNAAQDVTVNFTRGGSLGMTVNQMVPFYNVALQAPHKLLRVAKENPVRFMAAGTAYFTVPTMANWWRNKDKEWYKNLSTKEKADYWHFELPGEDNIVKLPKPFELGYIFASIPETVIDAQYREKPEEIIKSMAWMGKQLLPPVIPGAVVPIIEVWGNKDWAGRDIIPRGKQYRTLPEYQNKPSTTALMKFLGKYLKISPAQIEHIANGYTGGLYGRLARTVELGQKLVTGKGAEIEPADWPAVGTLFLREPGAPRRQIENFYKRLTRLQGLQGAKKETGASPELVKEILGSLTEYRVYSRVARELSPLFKRLSSTTDKKQRKALWNTIKGKLIIFDDPKSLQEKD